MDSRLISVRWPRKLSWRPGYERASGDGRRAERERHHTRWCMAALHAARRHPPCRLAPAMVIRGELLSSAGGEARKISLRPSDR